MPPTMEQTAQNQQQYQPDNTPQQAAYNMQCFNQNAWQEQPTRFIHSFTVSKAVTKIQNGFAILEITDNDAEEYNEHVYREFPMLGNKDTTADTKKKMLELIKQTQSNAKESRALSLK